MPEVYITIESDEATYETYKKRAEELGWISAEALIRHLLGDLHHYNDEINVRFVLSTDTKSEEAKTDAR